MLKSRTFKGNNSMKCFVAMAFGRPDTDQLFNTAICRVLGDKGIIPIRVDRIEFNDNIDDRIFQEIRKATFVIADLTYARPSVYYEAGFAEREVPVIYTVRRDHLAARADDDYGIYRVHFDLLMRNIIDWVDPGDQLFATRLDRRIEEVLIPIKTRLQVDQENTRNRNAFLALSHSARTEHILKTCDEVFSMAEIGGFALKPRGPYPQREFLHSSGQALDFIAIRLLESKDSTPPTKKSQIYIIKDQPDYTLNFQDHIKSLREIREHYIVCSFSTISYHHICEILPSFKPASDPRLLISETSVQIPAPSRDGLGEIYFDYGSTIFGGLGRKGACVSNPPSDLPSTKPYCEHNFPSTCRVFDCPTRTIKKKVSFQMIDNIQSVISFKESLLKAATSALAVFGSC